ncbi:hypothetical protein Dxin01_01091 [Deinococcus xinjiangensis]|uniref:Uncharacterized protein n=1 Tax=Deinococcus xinjiangensis TaxID=457454 RepID=A0ABP9V7V3_9DEIO
MTQAPEAASPTIEIGGATPPAQATPTERVSVKDSSVRKLEPLQNAALSILLALIVVGVGLTGMILGQWLYGAPKPPEGLQNLTDEHLQVYQKLTEMHQQQHREMFQVVVASAFLPLVTAVLGYLFGIQRRSGD